MSKPKVTIELETIEAVRIKVRIAGDINEYAKNFLAIYNNYKVDKDLLKVYNGYDDDVYLVCTKDVEQAAKDFLAQFGEVVSTTPVEAVRPVIYDYDYKDDVDVEFLEPEE